MSTEPETPAFQQLTADNHGPTVVVVSYILLVTTVIVVITRLITRLKVTRKLAIDDYLIIASVILCTAQTISLTFAANNGLGRHFDTLSNSQFEGFSKAIYATRILSIPTLAFAKSSTSCLIMGIRPPRPIQIAGQVVLGITNVWALAAMLALIFQCSVPNVWAYQSQCVNQWALYLSNVVWNVATDIALVLLPFFLMRNVQVSVEKRWVVNALFGSRIIVPAFAIAGAIAASDYWNATPADPTWHGVKAALWTQAIINSSIITSCIPCIKRFLADLSSGMMAVNIPEPLEMTMKGQSSSGTNENSGTTYVKSGSMASKLFRSSKMVSTQRSDQSRGSVDTNKARNLPSRPQFNPVHSSTNTRTVVKRSDSMKHLNEGIIVQTIDYDVREEFQDSSALENQTSRASSTSVRRVA